MMENSGKKKHSFNWKALFLQSLIIQIYIILASYLIDNWSFVIGIGLYLSHWFFLRRILLKEYFKALNLQNNRAYLLSNLHYKKALEYLNQNTWIDKYRSTILLNFSKNSYRELILYEISQNYMSSRDYAQGEAYLRKLNVDYPDNRLAASGLAMITYLNNLKTLEAKNEKVPNS